MSQDKKKAIEWPVECPECGQGKISPRVGVGREAGYKGMEALPIPDDLEIPTCDHCGVEWVDRRSAQKLDAALEAEYRLRLQALANAQLRELSAHRVTQARLERLLGLSQGYLSKVRAGVRIPSPTLVGCLRLLAGDPQRRLREMEDSFRGRAPVALEAPELPAVPLSRGERRER